VISRWDVLEVASAPTAQTASRALAALLEPMPFPVRASQVDGGSEFMAKEATCQAKGIPLFELPAGSPKLNGSAERAQRTKTEEFYECSTVPFTVASTSVALLHWEHTYNTVRPHQPLGYLTPLQL
jgi:putative transposase